MSLVDDANAAVRRTVQTALGLPDNYMRVSRQSYDAGHQGVPFGTVQIMIARDRGTPSKDFQDDGAGGFNEVLYEPVEFTASVQFFKAAPTPADLRGASVADDVSPFVGVTNGGFDIPIDGTIRKATGVNLSAVVTMFDVAAAVQAVLAGVLAGTTVVWTGKRFVVTSPTTAQSSAIGAATRPTSSGPPTDLSTLLGLTTAAGASPSDNSTGIAKPGNPALDLARRLPTVLRFESMVTYMQLIGLGYLRASPARDLSGIADKAWEARGGIDLTFNVISSETLATAAFAPPFTADLKVLEPGGAIDERTISVTPT